MTTHTPRSEAEAASVIADAAARRVPLSITGAGTKRGLGRFTQTQDVLSSAAITGITLHEPAELVIAARAGTPLAEVERKLAEDRQRLPFEPMDYRPLLGTSGRADDRRRRGHEPFRPAPHQGRRLPRFLPRRAFRQRARRGGEIRRAGDEERHRA